MSGDGYNARRLREEIISRSWADKWDQAKLEWRLVEIYEADEPETCLCGHTPIIEMCVLHNGKNGNFAEVGNVCVKKFLGLNSSKIFDALKRIRADHSKSLNPDALEFFYQRQSINRWEYDFYADTWRKRNLSVKQLTARININQKVLETFSSGRIRAHDIVAAQRHKQGPR